MAELFQRIVLSEHPIGLPNANCFSLQSFDQPVLKPGQALVKLKAVSVDPGTRSRLTPGASYARPLKLGEPIDAFGVGEVIETQSEAVTLGQTVALGAAWATHAVLSPRGYWQPIDETLAPLTTWIGVLGIPGLTAWFGLTRIGQLQAGERVLISSAAGPVGLTAAAVARHKGAGLIVGTAGGKQKCQECLATGLFDRMIDYKAPTGYAEQIAASGPEGFDIAFDNVGASFLNHAVAQMRMGGRVVISGQVADYNQTDPALLGFTGLRWMIAKRLKMEGIVVFDDLPNFFQAQKQLAALLADNKLISREVVSHGLATAPHAFIELFAKDSQSGRRIVML